MQPVALVRLVSPASPVPLAPPVPPVCLRVGFGFWVFLQRYELHQGNQSHQWEQCGHYKRCQAPMKAVITLPPVETVKRERKVDRKRQREKGRYFYARVANALGRRLVSAVLLGCTGNPPKRRTARLARSSGVRCFLALFAEECYWTAVLDFSRQRTSSHHPQA